MNIWRLSQASGLLGSTSFWQCSRRHTIALTTSTTTIQTVACGTFLTEWGSSGSGDGQFNDPEFLAVDANGNVFVPDASNNRIQKFTSAGTFLTAWGGTGNADGQFSGPSGVAVAANGDVFVVDSFNNRIQRFAGTGTFLGKWGSVGSADGQFSIPSHVAVDYDLDV